MKNIKAVDLRNGDVMINFGGEYAHTYFKGDIEQIQQDIETFKADGNCEGWEGNEIECWDDVYNSPTTDEIDIQSIGVRGFIMKFVNLTPHAITVNNTIIPPSGTIARMVEECEVVNTINGIDIIKKRFTKVVDLPKPKEDTMYIVSMVIAQNVERKDLVCPGEQIRDKAGRIIGCKNLCVY